MQLRFYVRSSQCINIIHHYIRIVKRHRFAWMRRRGRKKHRSADQVKPYANEKRFRKRSFTLCLIAVFDITRTSKCYVSFDIFLPKIDKKLSSKTSDFKLFSFVYGRLFTTSFTNSVRKTSDR